MNDAIESKSANGRPHDKVANRITIEGSERTRSITESSVVSSISLGNQDLSDAIRNAVKSKLDPRRDGDKIKTISSAGKSIKFPVKLMYILEECPQFGHIVSWTEDGLSFIIHDADKFEETVLPHIFKDAMFNSFLRKLYRWGFTKRSSEGRECCYINAKFQRGNYSSCMELSCTNVAQQVTSNRLRHEIDSARLAADAAMHYNETISQIQNLRQAQLVEQVLLQQQQQQQQQRNAMMYQMADLMNNQQPLYISNLGYSNVQGMQGHYNPLQMQMQMQMMNNNATQNSLLQQQLHLNPSLLSHPHIVAPQVTQLPLMNQQYASNLLNMDLNNQNANIDDTGLNGNMWRRGGNY